MSLLIPRSRSPPRLSHSPPLVSGVDLYGSASHPPLPASRPIFPLECIFFSEFDNTVGPKIFCQSPERGISADEFDSLSDYFIASPDLHRQLVTIHTENHTFLSLSMSLENKKYARNALLFNLSFVFPRDVGSAIFPYRSIIRKLGAIIETLELESEFLFKPESKMHLPSLIQKIYSQLNSIGNCSISANAANKINLKLYPSLLLPGEIYSHQVPIRIRDIEFLMKPEWDLILRQVLPFINNIHSIKRISTLLGIDLYLVKQCIKQLLYGKMIELIDIFQFSNIYIPESNILNLLKLNEKEKSAIIQWIKINENQNSSSSSTQSSQLNNNNSNSSIHSSSNSTQPTSSTTSTTSTTTTTEDSNNLLPTISFNYLIRILFSFDRNHCIRDYCTFYKFSYYSIDIRKLIQLAVLNQWIRRVHEFPILGNNGKSLEGNFYSSSANISSNQLNQSNNFNEFSSYNGFESTEPLTHRPSPSDLNSPRSAREPLSAGPAADIEFPISPNQLNYSNISNASNGGAGASELNTSISSNINEDSPSPSTSIESVWPSILPLLNGSHSMDELCSAFEIPRSKLLEEIQKNPNITIIKR